MEDRHIKYPSVMAELFSSITPGDPFFAIRRLDMRSVKAEIATRPMRSEVHGFLFVTGGEALLEAGDKSCYLHRNECTVIPAGQPFSVRYFNDCTGYMGGFSTEYAAGNAQGGNVMQTFSVLRRWDACKVLFGAERSPYITCILERLCSETADGHGQDHAHDSGHGNDHDARHGSAGGIGHGGGHGHGSVNRNDSGSAIGHGNRNIIRAYLGAFLTEIEEILVSDTGMEDAFRTENEICNRYVEMVFRRHDHGVPLSEYASELHISKDYLHKIVRRHTGKTPLGWIAEAVLLEAKTMLTHTSMTVNEIADAVGMEDPSYFSRFFKKYTGCTPLEYRNKGRKC